MHLHRCGLAIGSLVISRHSLDKYGNILVITLLKFVFLVLKDISDSVNVSLIVCD
jgi:hypothetical protein